MAKIIKTTPSRIGVVGPPGSLSDVVIREQHGKNVRIIYANSLLKLFELLEDKTVDSIVYPVENSQYGVDFHTDNLLRTSKSFIIGELHLEEALCILGKGKIDDIKIIVSSELGFSYWCDYSLPDFMKLKQEQVNNMGIAAQMASQNKTYGAIADRRVVELGIYPGLRILRKLMCQ